LHQQRGALSAEPGSRDHADALLLGREHDIPDPGIALRGTDRVRVPGIGHVCDLLDAAALEGIEDLLLPRLRGCDRQPKAPFAAAIIGCDLASAANRARIAASEGLSSPALGGVGAPRAVPDHAGI